MFAIFYSHDLIQKWGNPRIEYSVKSGIRNLQYYVKGEMFFYNFQKLTSPVYVHNSIKKVKNGM